MDDTDGTEVLGRERYPMDERMGPDETGPNDRSGQLVRIDRSATSQCCREDSSSTSAMAQPVSLVAVSATPTVWPQVGPHRQSTKATALRPDRLKPTGDMRTAPAASAWVARKRDHSCPSASGGGTSPGSASRSIGRPSGTARMSSGAATR